MGKDEGLSQEEERKSGMQVLYEMAKAYTRSSVCTLEDWALLHIDSVARVELGENPIERGLARIERNACFILSTIVEEIPETCSPDEARAWARSDEALASMKEIYPLLSLLDEQEGSNEPRRVYPRRDSDEDRRVWLVLSAVAALTYTERYWKQVESGDTDAALWTLYQVGHLNNSMHNNYFSPVVVRGYSSIAGRKQSRETQAKGKEEERQIWLAEARECQKRHPDWKPNRIAREVGKKVGRDRTTVLRYLLSLPEGALDDS